MNFSNAKFDIIIQGGQSNAEGCGKGPVTQELTLSENVFYLYAEKTVTVGQDNLNILFHDKPFVIEPAKEHGDGDEKIGNFSLTFAEEYEKSGLLAKDRKLLIIRAGVGGAGFQKKHWGLQDCLYLKLLELIQYALSLNSENRVVAFLWHQGEHDAFEKNTPENYRKQLTALIDGVRNCVGKKVPFIAGEFVADWTSKNIDICAPILQVIREVVAESGKGGFVETGDLLSNDQKIKNGDDIHFCRESLHILGRRYFGEYRRIIGE